MYDYLVIICLIVAGHLHSANFFFLYPQQMTGMLYFFNRSDIMSLWGQVVYSACTNFPGLVSAILSTEAHSISLSPPPHLHLLWFCLL